MATVEERLYEIIAESLSVSVDDIKSDSSFIDDLDADSLDVVEMIMAMESEFSSDGNDLEISDEEAEGIITVADALKFLDDKGISD
jgi:acyl carrier protein|tara:strand:- start:125 stop:382 length:258 start_codon:yes stop_codon:yes gene_type:complete